MKYSEIREKYQNHNYVVFVDRYACLISPFITKILVKTNLTPNMITILMMLSGILGSILFCVPNIIVKIVGIVFIHLWYVLDCCDGEIARIKKKYSLFGKEIDYTAHILNHPFFTIAFCFSMIQLGIYNNILLMLIFFIIIVTNLVFRNILMFNSIYETKILNSDTKEILINKGKKSILSKFVDNIPLYPNFVLTFPIIYVISYYLKLNLAYIYIILFMISSFIIVYLKLLNWIRKIVKL